MSTTTQTPALKPLKTTRTAALPVSIRRMLIASYDEQRRGLLQQVHSIERLIAKLKEEDGDGIPAGTDGPAAGGGGD